MSVLCKHIRFRKNFGQAFGLQRLDRRTEVDPRIVSEDVQRIDVSKSSGPVPDGYARSRELLG